MDLTKSTTSNANGHNGRKIAGSLSPSKTRGKTSKSDAMVQEAAGETNMINRLGRPQCAIAMSREETVLLSSAGDVVVCRCRDSAYAQSSYNTSPASPSVDETTVANQQITPWWEADCNPCFPQLEPEQGLLGGSPEPPDFDLAENESKDENDGAMEERSEIAPKTSLPDVSTDQNPEDDSLLPTLPLPSFDYSHFENGGNDMDPAAMPNTRFKPSIHPIPEETNNSSRKGMNGHVSSSARGGPLLEVPAVMHGVPTFLPAFSQIKITRLSAHPLGAHVLLISSEALLFAYGLNDHGQLGLGRKSSVTDDSLGFVTTPTIVTPFLENGGKAVECAAGVNHSLVVIRTMGKRVRRISHQDGFDSARALARVTSSPSRISSDVDSDEGSPFSSKLSDSMDHHQLYGFGENTSRQLGLVNPDQSQEEDVLLPHRVALHSKVWPGPENEAGFPSSGIFAVAASSSHSAALVRRATGAIELYTWGNGSDGALGFSSPTVNGTNGVNGGLPQRVVPFPTRVMAVSCLPKNPSEDHPVQLAVGPTSTFVLTSTGRCLSFGTSSDGLLGRGLGDASSMIPKEIEFSPEDGRVEIKSISVGARHAVAVAADGRAFTWGVGAEGRTGLCQTATGSSSSLPKIEAKPRMVELAMPDGEKIDESVDDQLNGALASCRLDDDRPRLDEKNLTNVLTACAGYDSTVFVTTSGSVLSCGKNSGRLGQGFSPSDALLPKKMCGGLQLWQ